MRNCSISWYPRFSHFAKFINSNDLWIFWSLSVDSHIIWKLWQTYSFSPLFSCIFFSLSFSAFRTTGIVLSRSGDTWHPFLVTNFKGKNLAFQQWCMMFAVEFWDMPSIKLGKFLSISSFLRVLFLLCQSDLSFYHVYKICLTSFICLPFGCDITQKLTYFLHVYRSITNTRNSA